MFVHLRKIAYHPLLVRSLFSDETAMEIAGVAWQQGAFGETATRKIAEEHMMGMSGERLMERRRKHT